MRLRLHHHHDGARVAYREAGTGPGLALLHSALLSHREFAPVVDDLADRFRVVLPDLPLHGNSEDRPRHSYDPEWLVEVMAGFLRATCGPRPLVAGHDVGALILLRAMATGALSPSRAVLLPSAMHRRSQRHRVERSVGRALRLGGVPGMDKVLSHTLRAAFRPSVGDKLSATGNPAAQDLLRHAFADMGGNAARARAWARAAASWPAEEQSDLLDAYAGITTPVLLLWADRDQAHPLAIAEEALDLLPDAQLRVLTGTGFLMAYDDPVGLAREIKAFCS